MKQVGRLAKGALDRVSSVSRKAFEGLSIVYAKRRLCRRKFTIVSNNCWGAHVYKALARPYTTPFVGLFIPPADYMLLIADVGHLVHADIKFISSSRHQGVERFRAERRADYPVGLLDGRIELHFMHYRSPEEAVEKWRRRTDRASWDDKSLFFKFCDHDGATDEQIRRFDRMTELSGVCFTGRKLNGTSRTVSVPGCEGGRVPDGGELAKVSGKYFSVVDWIASGGTGGMGPWWGYGL